jgi:hypothetical protein
MTEGGIKFSAATVEDLDSLKREINKQLRKTSEPADIRLLSELKTRVGGHIDNLDPDFVQAYKNADASYFQKVGLPFNSETLKAVDRKKFVEQIAPAIIGNKSNVDEFIKATGEDGIRIAKDAFYDSFSRAALKNDVLDPKAANKWLAKNQGGVSLVPGLDTELRAASNDVAALIAERNRLDAAFKKVECKDEYRCAFILCTTVNSGYNLLSSSASSSFCAGFQFASSSRIGAPTVRTCTSVFFAPEEEVEFPRNVRFIKTLLRVLSSLAGVT